MVDGLTVGRKILVLDGIGSNPIPPAKDRMWVTKVPVADLDTLSVPHFPGRYAGIGRLTLNQ